MRNNLIKCALIGSAMLMCAPYVFSQMSDEAVVKYVKEQTAAGKSKQQIGTELLARGVTEAQIRRLEKKYNEENANDKNKTNAGTDSRLRNSKNSTSTMAGDKDKDKNMELVEEEILWKIDEDGNLVKAGKIGADGKITKLLPDGTELKEADADLTNLLYGHNVFKNQNLTFTPSQNLATPVDYKLGPGDQVYIDIWGAAEDHITSSISPEGSINISQIGPVYLQGMTVDQANAYLQQLLASKYAGVEDQETQVNLTIGDVRSITVNVMGEVAVPGTYTLSPFSSVFAALYSAGGVNDLGSIRDVQVVRNGKVIATIDIYDYLFKGKTSDNMRLQEEDVIIVQPQRQVVAIEGNVKRPMRYEILPNESVSKLIEYAGGFAGNAYTDLVTISRSNGLENIMVNVPADNFDRFKLQDGDIVTVGEINGRYQNRVELRGSVMRPGFYAIDDETNTLRKLLQNSQGVLDDAYTNRALIYRQGDDLNLEIIPFNVENIITGRATDIILKRNDMIVISSIADIEPQGTYSISGMVSEPGTYPFAANTTVEDLIVMAGGLTPGASLVRADVARRMIDPYATVASDAIAEIYSFSIENGLVIAGDRNFKLMPYDIVQIRRSPGYEEQREMNIKGEVNFPGGYVLQSRNERISDIIERAGGLTTGAYAKGASLTRRLTQDELLARETTMRLANSNPNDSIDQSTLMLSDTYSIGIDLQAALSNPGSAADVILEPGDVLNIPQYSSIVKIAGTVMYPTSTTYIPGKKVKYYIERAGGYGERARKNKVFVVYMNGTVEKVNRNTVIEPGCQIIVPAKPQGGGVNWQQILAITTGVTGLTSALATIYAILKK